MAWNIELPGTKKRLTFAPPLTSGRILPYITSPSKPKPPAALPPPPSEAPVDSGTRLSPEQAYTFAAHLSQGVYSPEEQARLQSNPDAVAALYPQSSYITPDQGTAFAVDLSRGTYSPEQQQVLQSNGPVVAAIYPQEQVAGISQFFADGGYIQQSNQPGSPLEYYYGTRMANGGTYIPASPTQAAPAYSQPAGSTVNLGGGGAPGAPSPTPWSPQDVWLEGGGGVGGGGGIGEAGAIEGGQGGGGWLLAGLAGAAVGGGYLLHKHLKKKRAAGGK